MLKLALNNMTPFRLNYTLGHIFKLADIRKHIQTYEAQPQNAFFAALDAGQGISKHTKYIRKLKKLFTLKSCYRLRSTTSSTIGDVVILGSKEHPNIPSKNPRSI